jgi:hypothetical protein
MGEAAVVERVLERMAGLAVRGALTERGQRMVVFSVVDYKSGLHGWCIHTTTVT